MSASGTNAKAISAISANISIIVCVRERRQITNRQFCDQGTNEHVSVYTRSGIHHHHHLLAALWTRRVILICDIIKSKIHLSGYRLTNICIIPIRHKSQSLVSRVYIYRWKQMAYIPNIVLWKLQGDFFSNKIHREKKYCCVYFN